MRQMIKGETVILYERRQTGVDPFKRPVYEETPTEVEDVLIAPASVNANTSFSRDVYSDTDLSSKQIEYLLAIPKGDTHDWTDRTVEFWGQKFRTVGMPIQGIEANIPLRWNKKVKVERYNEEND